MTNTTSIPTKSIGPILINGQHINGEVKVPMATFESTLWPSTNRGAKLSRLAGGINTAIINYGMTRSIALKAPNAKIANDMVAKLNERFDDIAKVVSSTSRFCRLTNIHTKTVANNLYVRLQCFTGDAAGHNMTTKAASRVIEWLLSEYPELTYISISANFCTDKKVSSVNTILGRGKQVTAELTIPKDLCVKYLRTTPEKLVALNIDKNLLGGIIAGSLGSANAHYANMLLATYLATGQDAANIVEGSQGITYCEITQAGDLYFSVTVPNIIVGTVGNGKQHADIKDNLEALGCLADDKKPGVNSERLSEIIGATVLCGELSLMAAQTNPGELIRSHEVFER